MAVIIETRELSFRYSEDSPLALEDVTLSIEEGSFTAVLGHNGSGKSTLAKHFNAILLPSGGKVYVGGIDTTGEARLFDIRKTAGMVFQNPDNQIVANVVEEDVAFACENMGLPPEEIRRRVDESLAAVGILAMQPRCIVMDEPTAMLDPSGRAEVMAAIQRLNRSMGVTVVLITHHMDEAAAAQRVIVMKQGRVALDGTPRQIFSQVERMRELSLSVPQTVELLYALDRDGAGLSLEALSVEECADEILKYLEA